MSAGVTSLGLLFVEPDATASLMTPHHSERSTASSERRQLDAHIRIHALDRVDQRIRPSETGVPRQYSVLLLRSGQVEAHDNRRRRRAHTSHGQAGPNAQRMRQPVCEAKPGVGKCDPAHEASQRYFGPQGQIAEVSVNSP